MIYLSNHHAHTEFSDGKQAPVEYLFKAREKNLNSYGFSDHAPIPLDNMGSMSMQDLPRYLRQIDQLKEIYSDKLQVCKSLEVDYIPDIINVKSSHILSANLDYTIGAVHYIDHFADGNAFGFESSHENFQRGIKEIFDGDVSALIKRYYTLIREMVEYYPPDIVAHLDRIKKLNQGNRYFDESAKWYQEEVIKTLEIIAKADCIMEVNTKGYYNGEIEETYPGKWILEIAHELQIPVHLASDAHHPDHIISGFKFGIRQLRRIGFKRLTQFVDSQWQETALLRPRIFIT